MLKYHIQTIEVGSGGIDSIDFTNISQEYDDLYITLSHRLSGSTNGQQLVLRFNGSTTGYYRRQVYSYYPSSTGDYAGGSNETHSRFAFVQHSGTTANSFGNASLHIFDYTSSTAKSFGAEAVVASNTDTYANSSYVNYWSGTSPITSVSLSSLLDGASFAQYSSASLYGIKHGTSGEVEVASGGEISYSGGYTIHTFNSSGTFVANRNLDVEYLVVAGGGGGGTLRGGGGGAGGYRSSVVGESSGGGSSAESKITVSSGQNFLVQVGAGGSGSTSQTVTGTSGTSSSFATITSVGGGGGDSNNVLAALSGGSGGGAVNTGTAGSGTTNQGFAGGVGSGAGSTQASGGGGGAGAVGANASSGNGGDGGAGVASSITGSAVARAGGGGGGAESGAGGAGGSGVGGAGTSDASTPGAGTANTGSGGGGGGWNGQTVGPGGAGGSGVVIIRYLTP